jgi:integrative and conjugative element protein (TIGR02256 family)
MAITNYLIWMTRDHLFQILDYSNITFPKETGGIFMGYRQENQLVITNVIGAGPKAVHEHNSFNPDNEYHETEMARIYKESNQINTYIGDWHTHPNSGSYLSSRDKKTIINISQNRECRLKQPIMMILGTFPFELKVWLYVKSTFRNYYPVKILFY